MADDTSHMEKIQEILLGLSGEAAFSGEAMKQFLELKDEVDSQESTIKYLRRERESDKDKIGDLNSKITEQQAIIESLHHEVEGWRTRENEFKDREDNCLKNELAAFYSEKRVEDHQQMVGLIFRNSILRKTSHGQELTHQPGSPEMKDQYGNIQQYHTPAGFEATPVKKDEVESEE